MASNISIFSFQNYREFLGSYLEECKKNGESLRAVSRRCAISSPNYLQQVIQGRRNLSEHFAKKIAAGSQMNSCQTDYLIALVALESADSDKKRQEALDKMWRAANTSERRTIKDAELHSNWANPIVWETAKTVLFSEQLDVLHSLLRNIASKEEIENSIKYLKDRGYLVSPSQDTSKSTTSSVDFQPSNDVRRIELQRSHNRFLQLAQHRLNDALGDREFQGLTVAIKKSDFEDIRKLCRDFVQKINQDFSVDTQGDEVIRLQLCVFKLFDQNK